MKTSAAITISINNNDNNNSDKRMNLVSFVRYQYSNVDVKNLASKFRNNAHNKRPECGESKQWNTCTHLSYVLLPFHLQKQLLTHHAAPKLWRFRTKLYQWANQAPDSGKGSLKRRRQSAKSATWNPRWRRETWKWRSSKWRKTTTCPSPTKTDTRSCRWAPRKMAE